MKLNGGILTTSGVYFVLCETRNCDEDEAIICSGRSDGQRMMLRRLTEPAEFVSIKELFGTWKDGHLAAALSAQGETFFLSELAVSRQIIRGSGYTRDDSLGLGRMTSLKQVEEDLFALGYGGQVYRRSTSIDWQPMHVDRERAVPGANVCLYDVVKGPEGFLYFGGIELAKFARTPEMIAADEADDEDRWIELLLAVPGDDKMSLRCYDGTWRDLGMEAQGALTVILQTDIHAWTMFSNYGVAWKTEDFASIEEIVVLGDRKKFWDVKNIAKRNFVLVGQQLNELVNDELYIFSQPLPAQGNGYTNITGNEVLLSAFHENGLVELRDGTWREIAVIFE